MIYDLWPFTCTGACTHWVQPHWVQPHSLGCLLRTAQRGGTYWVPTWTAWTHWRRSGSRARCRRPGPTRKRAHDVEIVTLQNRLGKQTVFHISMGILILLKTIGAYWAELFSCNHQFISELISTQLRISHRATANSLYLKGLVKRHFK